MEVVEATVGEVFNFWNALRIYYSRPNSINKQVLFSEEILSARLKCTDLNDCHKLFEELSSELRVKSDAFKNSDYQSLELLVGSTEDAFLNMHDMHLLVRRLIPKLYLDDTAEFYEFIFCDKLKSEVYIFTKCITRTAPSGLHSVDFKKQDPFIILKFNFIHLVCKSETVRLFYDKSLGDKGITWLKAVFLTKFTRLVSSNSSANKSNKLTYESKVDIVQYYKFYETMKSKYAKYLIENWTENTDPKKFVYEDIGIASYIIMMWNGGNTPDAQTKKQRFIDLGCGNGLLVHILNSEGHLGVGLDMRKRKIWDAYPITTILKEETIIPTRDTSYPDAEWLIGNHSDELTAWIPIMARRSNRCCHYFVLPCCPYQLNGMKFQRRDSNLSSYQDFICYVKDVSEFCGFETYVDKLRIPSTKRICLIGVNRADLSQDKYCLLNRTIDDFITQECASSSDQEGIAEKDKNKHLDFRVRKSVEAVRNCTKLPQELIDRVLKIVMSELLKKNVTCTVINGKMTHKWNRGRRVPIRELASCIDEEHLKELKKECKGLQTLLKNHHFLFEVAQGSVQFRSPESMLKICKKFLENQDQLKWKRKKCWLFNNHPDKCPLGDETCSYSHD